MSPARHGGYRTALGGAHAGECPHHSESDWLEYKKHKVKQSACMIILEVHKKKVSTGRDG